MTVDVCCPHCHRGYSLAENLVGKKVRCKTCQTPFVVELDEEIEDYGGDPAPDENTFWETSEPRETSQPQPRPRRKSYSQKKPQQASPVFDSDEDDDDDDEGYYSSPQPSSTGKIIGVVSAIFSILLGMFIVGVVAVSKRAAREKRRQNNEQWVEANRQFDQMDRIFDQQRDILNNDWKRQQEDMDRMSDALRQSSQNSLNRQQEAMDRIRQDAERITESAMNTRPPGFPSSPFGSRPGFPSARSGLPLSTNTESAVDNTPKGPPDPDYFRQLPPGYEVVPEKMEIPDGTSILASDGRYWYKAETTRQVGNLRLKFFVKSDPAKRQVIRDRSELYIHASHLAALMGDAYPLSLASHLPPEERYKVFAAPETSYDRIPREFVEIPPDVELSRGLPVLARWEQLWYPAEIAETSPEKLTIRWTHLNILKEELERGNVRLHSDLLSHLQGEPQLDSSQQLATLFETHTLQEKTVPILPRGYEQVAAGLKLVPDTPVLAKTGDEWISAKVVADEGAKVKIRRNSFAALFDEQFERSQLWIHEDLSKALQSLQSSQQVTSQESPTDEPATHQPQEEPEFPRERLVAFIPAFLNYRGLPEEYVAVPLNVKLPSGTPLLKPIGRSWYAVECVADRGRQLELKSYDTQSEQTETRQNVRIHTYLLRELRGTTYLEGTEPPVIQAIDPKLRVIKLVKLYEPQLNAYEELPEEYVGLPSDLRLTRGTPLLVNRDGLWTAASANFSSGRKVMVDWRSDSTARPELVEQSDVRIHGKLLEGLQDLK